MPFVVHKCIKHTSTCMQFTSQKKKKKKIKKTTRILEIKIVFISTKLTFKVN
jgi:hypothetical protein